MTLIENEIFHIYNQGNNKQQLFFQERNYHYFLHLVEKFIVPVCDIFAYCLMPNHFHFLIYCNEKSVVKIKHGGNEITQLSNGFRKLQSSFALAINKQENRTGSIFRQNTKAKIVSQHNYATTCFHYIHQNPLRANLVNKLSDWHHSSYPEYINKNGFCNLELSKTLLNINFDNFKEESEMVINSDLITKIM